MADFKSTLLTLGDDAFFELIRNYLGPIKTPFNKHDLIGRLLSFLRTDTIQNRIVSLIDDDDATILSGVWVLGEPTHEDLFAFFEGDYGFLDLHNRLLNLEDRLLVYRDGAYVRLNPEILPRLLPGIVHPSRLFNTRPVDTAASAPWINDSLLVAVFAYLLQEPELYRGDGTLRKRAGETLARLIPSLLVPTTSVEEPQSAAERLRIDLVVDALVGLGLVAEEGNRVRPIVPAWHRWSRVEPVIRLAELGGSAATGRDGERVDTILASRAILRNTGPGVGLPPDALIKLVAASTGVPARSASHAVASLERFGLLERSDDLLTVAMLPEPQSAADAPPIVIGANFELTLPAVAFSDGLFVAQVSELERHDRYVQFELTKARLATALRSGLAVNHISDRLRSLAGGRIPQNVTASIRSWEEEYRSIRLHRGVVLEVEEARRFTVEHSEALQALIREELAPGIYLLDEEDVPDAQAALRESGVELIPELPPGNPAGFVSWHDSEPAPEVEGRMERVKGMLESVSASKPLELPGDNPLREELQSELAVKRFPPEQTQELRQRIERKLIVSSEQLRSGTLKAEKTEARGLDYAGKVRIVEQTLNVGGYLEVIERTADGEPVRRLVEPQNLKKDGTELLLEARELPNRDPVVLPVSKLGLVRRLRAALFTRPPAG